VIVLLLCVGIGLLVGCWSSCRSRETANRVKCASNLRQIGQAMLLYANDNGGHYPRVTYVAGPEPQPVWGTGAANKEPMTGVEPNDVTAVWFLLLRTQDITSEVFACPSSNVEKDVFGGGTNGPLDRANFTDVKKNLSYSVHNPYVRDGVIPAGDTSYWTTSMGAEFAVAADISPGVAGGGNVLVVTVKSSAKDMRQANSQNHDGDGQNILYGDGHVAWESNPLVGVERDNIFTTRDGRVAASPVDVNDSVLLPTDD
jgi:prepilin-type processing-associated H-X9-DG protein